MTSIRLVALVLAWQVAATVARADELRFSLNEDARDELTFTSRAPLESITGRAGKIRGFVAIPDPAELLGAAVDAWFEVDLTTIDTGIALRNEHMRGRFLETSQYPTATLKLNEVMSAVVADDTQPDGVRSVSALEAGVPTRVSVHGSFQLHGQEREVVVDDLTITHVDESESTRGVRPGALLSIVGSFTLRLQDYNIERPRGLIMRLSDKVLIKFHMMAATGIPAPSLTE